MLHENFFKNIKKSFETHKNAQQTHINFYLKWIAFQVTNIFHKYAACDDVNGEDVVHLWWLGAKTGNRKWEFLNVSLINLDYLWCHFSFLVALWSFLMIFNKFNFLKQIYWIFTKFSLITPIFFLKKQLFENLLNLPQIQKFTMLTTNTKNH